MLQVIYREFSSITSLRYEVCCLMRYTGAIEIQSESE